MTNEPRELFAETGPIEAAGRYEMTNEHASGGVLDLFRVALERGGDAIAGLETLYKLHAAEREHHARLAFADALASFQATCPPVPRSSKAEIVSQKGTRFGYLYADFEQIVETIGPHLRAAGLSFSFDSSVDGGALTCVCHLRHTQGHGESAKFTLPTSSSAGMSDQQKVAAALTFAKRQALTAILGLALTDPDPDGVADPTTIGEESAANIAALIEEVGANRAKVLAFAKVEHLSDIREADKAGIVRSLEAMRKQGGA